MNRRDFIVLATTACAGCAGQQGTPTEPMVTRSVDAGPMEQYSADGVYDRFRHQGFFLITKNGGTFALSSDCTHRDCPLRALQDHTFACKCHGSRFSQEGDVLHGPAMRNLPRYPTAVNDQQHLIVEVRRVKSDEG